MILKGATTTKPKAEELKADLLKKLKLKERNEIPGITEERFYQIFMNDQIFADGFELRMIITFLEIYVFEFEEKYKILINKYPRKRK